MSELKNCPFCGQQPVMELHEDIGSIFITCDYNDAVHSNVCVTAQGITESEAIAAWNKRSEAQRNDGWVRVEDRLPNEDVRVLACYESTNRGVLTGKFSEPKVEFLFRKLTYPNAGALIWTEPETTHWMPLPPCPDSND